MRPHQVIVTHAAMDFDALGALVAARRLYPQARACAHGGMNRNVREFVSLHTDELDLADASHLELDGVSRVVVVETPHLGRLGPFADVIRREGVEVTLFDHHLAAGEPSPEWVSPGCHVRSEDGALSTTMVSILAERGLDPTPTEATALALGIHEDTGSLTYPTTTLRDIEALAYCARNGASQELVGAFLHTPLGGDERALLTTLVDSAEPHTVGGTQVLVAAAAWPRYVDGVSTLATKIVELSDCRALVMLVEMEGRVFAVGRSRVPSLDMRAALAPVGGGGHAPASSAIIRGSTLAQVRERIVGALPAAVAAAPRARDIMSTPAWFVNADSTIDQAIDECRRRHTSGVQVEAGGVLAGAVAREDLDRAIGHGLGHAPVRAVMSSQLDAINPDAPLAEVQRRLARSSAGRLAVVEGEAQTPAVGSVLGVVTRSDLLAALREARAPVDETAPADLADELATLGLDRLWRAVQHAAADFSGVYLVGGAVRDLLLGERSFDIDLAVEGDGVAFARELSPVLDGRVHPHDKFHTAVVLAGDLRVDVASARTEQYEYPAALPIVEHSSIRHDLFRRDFTINAMAVAVRSEEFGRLLDPYGGRTDLAAGVIRVLHNLSFIEDPTRIFRAVRYETRYGFSMDSRTRELARGCVDMGLVGELSGARVRDELVALLDERSVAATLVRLRELGLAESLHPALDCSDQTIALVDRLDALRAQHAPQLPVWRLRLAAMTRSLPGDDVVGWLDALRVRRRDARAVAAGAVLAPRLVGLLADAPTPAAVAELLDPHPDEVALMAAGLGSQAALGYLEALRRVRLEVDGTVLRRELGVAESPLVGELLAELLRRKRNGELDGYQDELDTARRLLAEAEA